MNSRQTLELLAQYESRNILFAEPDGSWPIVWERARGVHVWDAEGRKYLDLTAAFGVAAAGHANPGVVRAGQRQMAKLLHAMGDVHPHELKARLACELSRITFERWGSLSRTTHPPSLRCGAASHAPRGGGKTQSPIPNPQKPEMATGKTIFCNSGFEAVEAALKTALLATGKRGVIAFEGAYHGLGYGALNATHREFFRGPFLPQLREFGRFVPFPVAADVRRLHYQNPQSAIRNPQSADRLRLLLRQEKIGAILVEPIQTRGGINVPPPEFLPLLRKLCDEHGALLILDEIYTGFGRTGKWFACEHSGVVPDLICLGKALTGGFPLSACVGRADVMDAAWPPSQGEAIHTSTFLGHPVGCAMALAQIGEIRRLKLCERSARLGRNLLAALNGINAPDDASLPPSSDFGETSWRGNSRTTHHASRLAMQARGFGLLAGLELRRPDGSPAGKEAIEIIKAMLRRGFILLPEGEHGNVISFTPPLTITEAQLAATVKALAEILNHG